MPTKTDSLEDVCSKFAASPSLTLPFKAVDAKAYGHAFPRELVTACKLAEKKKLPKHGALNDLNLEHPVLPTTDAEVKKMLEGEVNSVYPIAITAHLNALLPLTYTGTSSYWFLVHAESSEDEAVVYELSVHDDSIALRHPSIAGAYLEKAPKGKAPKRPRPGSPEALFSRTRWVVDALWGQKFANIERGLRSAPPLGEYFEEEKQLSTLPSLALYWLIANALLRNDAIFKLAAKATAKSKSVFVQYVRTELTKWIEGGRKKPFLHLSAEKTARLLSIVDEEPANFSRDPEVPWPPAAAVAAVPAQKGASDLETELLKKPDDATYHLKVLAKTASAARKKQLAAVGVAQKGVKFVLAPPPEVEALWKEADSELAHPIAALVKAGLKRDWSDKKAATPLVRALGPVKHERALGLLIEMATMSDLDNHRRLATAQTLGTFYAEDPKAQAALRGLIETVAKGESGVDWRRPIVPALLSLHRTKSKELPKALAAAEKVGDKDVAEAYWSVVIALGDKARAKKLEKAKESGCAHYNAAMGLFSPKQATAVLAKELEDYLDNNRDTRDRFISPMLAGLLIANPKNAQHIALAKEILASRNWDNARAVLVGLQHSKVPELVELVKKWSKARSGEDEPKMGYVKMDRPSELAERALARA